MRPALLALLLLAGPLFAAPTVEGHGEDAERAWTRAMEAAQDRIRQLLPASFGAAAWAADSPALAPALLKRTRAVEKVGEPEPSVTVDGKRLVVARYRVSLTEAYLSEARGLAREEMAQDRAWLAGRVIAWILAALVVGGAYLRLEDSTRGYATRLLRLGAAVVLGLAAFALWLIG